MSPIENATKVIEVHHKDHPCWRLTIGTKTAAFLLPVVTKDGYGEIRFSASGTQTEDGIEIWTP